MNKEFMGLGKRLKSKGFVSSIALENLNNEKTLIINIGIINEFMTKEVLHFSNINRIMPTILGLNKRLDRAVVRFFADTYEKDSLENELAEERYLDSSTESKVIAKELYELAKSHKVYHKSTTDGFWCYEFKKLIENNSFNNILITGCYTDIHVMNLALALNTYFSSFKENVNVIIVEEAVDTFNLPGHNADIYNLMSLNILKSNGVQTLKLHDEKEEDSNLKLYPLTNEQRFTLECEMLSVLDCDIDDSVKEDVESALTAISSNNADIIK